MPRTTFIPDEVIRDAMEAGNHVTVSQAMKTLQANCMRGGLAAHMRYPDEDDPVPFSSDFVANVVRSEWASLASDMSLDFMKIGLTVVLLPTLRNIRRQQARVKAQSSPTRASSSESGGGGGDDDDGSYSDSGSYSYSEDENALFPRAAHGGGDGDDDDNDDDDDDDDYAGGHIPSDFSMRLIRPELGTYRIGMRHDRHGRVRYGVYRLANAGGGQNHRLKRARVFVLYPPSSDGLTLTSPVGMALPHLRRHTTLMRLFVDAESHRGRAELGLQRMFGASGASGAGGGGGGSNKPLPMSMSIGSRVPGEPVQQAVDVPQDSELGRYQKKLAPIVDGMSTRSDGRFAAPPQAGPSDRELDQIGTLTEVGRNTFTAPDNHTITAIAPAATYAGLPAILAMIENSIVHAFNLTREQLDGAGTAHAAGADVTLLSLSLVVGQYRAAIRWALRDGLNYAYRDSLRPDFTPRGARPRGHGRARARDPVAANVQEHLARTAHRHHEQHDATSPTHSSDRAKEHDAIIHHAIINKAYAERADDRDRRDRAALVEGGGGDPATMRARAAAQARGDQIRRARTAADADADGDADGGGGRAKRQSGGEQDDENDARWELLRRDGGALSLLTDAARGAAREKRAGKIPDAVRRTGRVSIDVDFHARYTVSRDSASQACQDGVISFETSKMLIMHTMGLDVSMMDRTTTHPSHARLRDAQLVQRAGMLGGGGDPVVSVKPPPAAAGAPAPAAAANTPQEGAVARTGDAHTREDENAAGAEQQSEQAKKRRKEEEDDKGGDAAGDKKPTETNGKNSEKGAKQAAASKKRKADSDADAAPKGGGGKGTSGGAKRARR